MIVGPAWLRLALAVFVFTCFSSLALAAGPAAVAEEPSSPSATSADVKPGKPGKPDRLDGSPGRKSGEQTPSGADEKSHPTRAGKRAEKTGAAADSVEHEDDDAVRTKTTRRSDPDAAEDADEDNADSAAQRPKPQWAQGLPDEHEVAPQPAADSTQTGAGDMGTPAPEAPPAEVSPELPPATEPIESAAPGVPEASDVPDEPVGVQPVTSPRRAKPVGPPSIAAHGRLSVVGSNPSTASDIAKATPAGPVAHDVATSPAADPGQTLVASDATALPPAPPPSIALAAAGFIADVGTITVSVVHMAATAVAHAFGPDAFLGVPYLLATSVANAAAAAGRTFAGGTLVPPTSGPLRVEYGILDGLAFFTPTKPPAGANLPPGETPAERPMPVILVNGTVLTQGLNWSVGAPVLANAGYEVYTFNYGNSTPFPGFPIQSTADIARSAEELSAFVDQVRLETGSDKVILIGHSQGGGILPAYYINNLDGADKVAHVIGIAPSNHGTDFNGLALFTRIPILGPVTLGVLDAFAPAFTQQLVGSPFQEEVYGNGDTRPGPRYTNIISANDWIVTPYTQQPLDGPNVTNVVLQQIYPTAVIGHANIVLSPLTWAQVLAALEADTEVEAVDPEPARVAA